MRCSGVEFEIRGFTDICFLNRFEIRGFTDIRFSTDLKSADLRISVFQVDIRGFWRIFKNRLNNLKIG